LSAPTINPTERSLLGRPVKEGFVVVGHNVKMRYTLLLSYLQSFCKFKVAVSFGVLKRIIERECFVLYT